MSDAEDMSGYDESAEEAEEQSEREEGEHVEEGEEAAEEEEEEQEEEEKLEDKPLTEDMIRESLTTLARIGNGLSHAYITMNVINRELTDIQRASSLIHLRHVNFSRNFLKNLSPLSSLTHLLTLKVDDNLLSKVNVEELPYLQTASFANNQISTLEGFTHPLLSKLHLARNAIPRVNFPDPQRLSNLTILDMYGNKLETLAGSFPPNLNELYLGANLISSFGLTEGLSNLRVLHLRDNQIAKLDGLADAGMDNLSYLNVRGNSIEDVSEIAKLKPMKQIRALILLENPVFELDDYRIEVLAALDATKNLMRLDKDDVEKDELEEAKSLIEEQEEKRREEEEERRKEEEEMQAAELAEARQRTDLTDNSTSGQSPTE